MLLYRVFPYLEHADGGAPGHPLYLHPVQGKGRWDNPSMYMISYLATSPEAAMGEAFGNLSVWTPSMLRFPAIPGSEKALGVYQLDEEANPLIDLDDARVLADRGIRPTHIVIRNRPRTQGMAADIYHEHRWAGIRWWSYHRPQWSLVALWAADNLVVHGVEAVRGHAALDDAASRLAKVRRGI